MRIRLKLFLIFALIAAVPLLVLSLFSFLTNLHNTRSSLRSALDHEIAVATDVYQASLRAREQELLTLASSRQVIAYVREGRRPAVATNGQSGPGSALGSSLSDYWVDALSLLLRTQRSYSAIACFDPGKRLLFVAEPAFGSAAGSVVFRTGDLVQKQHQPDARIWNAKGREAVCGIITVASAGKTLRCATPVYTADETSTAPGALVTDLKIDSLLTDVTRRAELTGAVESNGYGPSSVVVVLDKSGEIVYHTNDALKHQQVNGSMPDFAPVSLPMMSGEAGSKIYRAAGGDEWLAVYAPLQPHGLSLAIARNVSLAAGGTRRAGWLGLALALLLGVGVAMVLTLLYQRQTQSIERVTEGVAAIAKGELDLHIEARSTDDMRPLADSVNLMTERLREQIAREAETRQFQS
ncbi:MAG: HAMP domain-containing protein, partial [Pyrinomonadaceae bacterium]